MTTIVLVRHGHVDGISPERFRGRRDLQLSSIGLVQARQAAGHVAGRWQPAGIYCSPLGRCVRTAREIGAACGVQFESLDELNDIDYGDWEWRSHAEARAQWPETFDLWQRAPQRVRFPRGESLQDVSARVADALRLILSRHPEQTSVVVGHDSSNRVLLLHLLGLPLSGYWNLAQSPCGISVLDVTADGARLLSLNETQHLGPQ